MRTMSINKQDVYYALPISRTDRVDEYGNITGQTDITYSDPIKVRMNVSAARGTSEVEQFGMNVNYNKTMLTSDMNCPIDESAILWLGKTPTDGSHNYVVSAVAKSINSIAYAVREVTTRYE